MGMKASSTPKRTGLANALFSGTRLMSIYAAKMDTIVAGRAGCLKMGSLAAYGEVTFELFGTSRCRGR